MGKILRIVVRNKWRLYRPALSPGSRDVARRMGRGPRPGESMRFTANVIAGGNRPRHAGSIPGDPE